jgi:two-component system, NarL family, response regulator DegU
MDDRPIRVAVVDDHPIVRAGIRAVLAPAADLEIVAEGASGHDALRLLDEANPDVLILDVNLPGINGLEVIRRLRSRGDPIPIVILSVHNDSQTVLGLLEAGASGYVLKEEALELLPNAVRAAARGETWLSSAVAAQVVRRAVSQGSGDACLAPAAGGGRGPPLPSPLTPREIEVVELLAQGLDNAAIAQRLVLTKRTVQNHVSIIYDKLGVSSRTEALLYAVQQGWTHLS